MQIDYLLDRAKTVTGSDAETARRIGVGPNHLSDFRHGREKCPWKKHLALCDVAGLSPSETVQHMQDVAGIATGKLAAGVVGFSLLAVLGVADTAGRIFDALSTMYRASIR